MRTHCAVTPVAKVLLSVLRDLTRPFAAQNPKALAEFPHMRTILLGRPVTRKGWAACIRPTRPDLLGAKNGVTRIRKLQSWIAFRMTIRG